ncbi:MAG TPA: phosphatidate cytidylyltransferase [Stellaceae bacterium]
MARGGRDALQRTLSSLVLAPLPIAAIWFGSPWLPLLTALAGAVMAWEWGRLCRRGRPGAIETPVGILLVAAVLGAVAIVSLVAAGPALGAALLGAGIVFWAARSRSAAEPGWAALGTLWVALPCVSLVWLAGAPAGGRTTLLWLLAVVWATDIGAYVFGRVLGGPRLAPRWSPHKTWAGLAGGIACAALAGAGTAQVLAISPAARLILLSAALAVVGQLGDLAESLAKRRFGVKDSSALIPGHGGLLDRLDGLLAVVPTVALLTLIGGSSILTWR